MGNIQLKYVFVWCLCNVTFLCKALDYLAIGIHEIGSLSGCRMERLVNHGMSGLPAFLTLEGGLNSGFMIAHCTAAALSKNRFIQ